MQLSMMRCCLHVHHRHFAFHNVCRDVVFCYYVTNRNQLHHHLHRYPNRHYNCFLYIYHDCVSSLFMLSVNVVPSAAALATVPRTWEKDFCAAHVTLLFVKLTAPIQLVKMSYDVIWTADEYFVLLLLLLLFLLSLVSLCLFVLLMLTLNEICVVADNYFCCHHICVT